MPQKPQDRVTCQAELQQIVQQIQELYFAGPLIDGWLESYRGESNQEASQSICYRLCGFDTKGEKWSYSCPLDQLPSISMAIARYQKIMQLLQRKHYLETLLMQLPE